MATTCQGYDRVLGTLRNVAMEGEASSLDGGMAVELQYKVCQSLDEVRSTLQMEPASILGLYFEAGCHVSHKLQFLESLNFTTHSLAFIVFAKVITGAHSIGSASLSVAPPQNDMAVAEFVGMYGDSYITKILTGAEYYASFVYHTTTQEDKMDLLAKIKAHLLSGGSDYANIDSRIAKFNASCNVLSMDFCQTMQGISNVALPEPTHLFDFAHKLLTLAINKPQVISFECVGYEHALGFQDCSFAPIVRSRSLIVEDAAFLLLLSQVKCLENDVQAIEAVLFRYGMYEGPVRSFFNDVKGAIKVDRAAVQIMMQTYRSNVMEDEVRCPASFRSLAYSERVHSSYWIAEQSNYIGGDGGNEHVYVTNVQKFMSTGRRIVSIQLRSGLWIDRITIRYNNNEMFDWGGDGGSPSETLYVPEGVGFSKIRMKDNGYFVSFLEFVLTDGSSIHGGNLNHGSGQDITYEPYKAPNFLYFCGFDAHAGLYIDALRAVFAKFHI